MGEDMRIIAGEARGRRLYAPGGEETRPTADRIRESLFNILGTRTVGARVLDLFGGTGALALEAMSRGAQQAVIVDSNIKAIQCIRRNAEVTLGRGFEERIRIIRADYRKAIERLEGTFDLVFLDPPYRMEAAYKDALSRLRASGHLQTDTMVILERESARTVDIPAEFSVVDVRTYGDTVVEFIREGVQE